MELYIDGTRVPMFGETGVDIVDTIQNVKDIKRIFTSFSQQFTIPATKTVNKIFRHYYDFNVQNGFDARFKIDGSIKVRGVDFRVGKIRLNGAVKKNGVVHSYKIVFFGNTVELSDLIGEDELSSLEFNTYNHAYDLSTVKTGFVTGLGSGGASSTAREIIYPLISHTTQFQYDANGFHKFGDSSTKLSYTDLKPAINVPIILDAIESKYGITFSNDFFSEDDIDKLYLWLHREQGNITSGNESQTFIIENEDWVLNTGSDFRPVESYIQDAGTNFEIQDYFRYKVLLTPQTTALSGLYSIKMTDVETGEVVGSWTNQSGTQTFTSSYLSSTAPRVWKIRTEIETDGQLITFNLDLTIERTYRFIDTDDGQNWYWDETVFNTTYDSPNATESMVGEIVVSQQMPKMKIIDFLTGIFKCFNLTAYYEDGEIVVKALDTYYDEGNTYDITKYIDFGQKITVDRVLPFRAVKFNFMPPKTFLAIKRNEITGQEFGSLEYTGGDAFDGKLYDIKLPFEKMMFERIENEVNSTPSQIVYGWFVDAKQDSTIGAPLLFYNRESYSTAQLITWSDASTSGSYNCPSNSLADGSQTLNFNAEIDEVDLTLNENSLFQTYYNRYISNVYNKQARLTTFHAFLPQWLILNYQLNDIFVINNREYRINSVKVNPQTGKAKLELINRLDSINTEESATQSAPNVNDAVISTFGTTSLTVAWTDLTSSRVASYNVYQDGVFVANVALGVERYVFTGLTPSTSYEFWVQALTEDGYESTLKEDKNVITGTTIASP